MWYVNATMGLTHKNIHVVVAGLITEEEKDLYLSGRRKNTTKHKKDMLNITRDIINRFYAPFNRELANILNDKRYLYT